MYLYDHTRDPAGCFSFNPEGTPHISKQGGYISKYYLSWQKLKNRGLSLQLKIEMPGVFIDCGVRHLREKNKNKLLVLGVKYVLQLAS